MSQDDDDDEADILNQTIAFVKTVWADRINLDFTPCFEDRFVLSTRFDFSRFQLAD